MAVLPKTLTTSVPFTDPQNVILANGYLTLDLSAPAVVFPSSGQVVPTRVTITLDANGQVTGLPKLWGNDQLNPTNTLYLANIYNSNGLLTSGPLYWSLTGGSPINLSAVTPVSFATLSFSLPGFNQANFTSSGTFNIPASITKLKVTVVGAGGAGGGGGATAAMGSGGGAGGAAIVWLAGMTPGNTITVTVGTGGTGVASGAGNAGTASSISSGTQTISTVTANGGGGGTGNTAGLQGGGLGGTATGGTINFSGASGGPVSSTSIASSNGGDSIFAGGGQASGGAAGAAGAGGAGNNSNPGTGGAGANGIVIFEWMI